MRLMRPLLLALGAGQLGLGLFMAIAPGAFFDALGPFGERNDHYIRDSATLYIALGIALFVAAERRSWRIPVLGFMAIQYAIHTVNHVIDVGDADPEWVGVLDVVLLLAFVPLAWWLAREERAAES